MQRSHHQSSSTDYEKDPNYRTIDFLNQTETLLKDNKVESSHYTILNVIPKTIFQEFKNISFFWYVTLIGLEFSPYSTSSSIKLGILIPVVILITYTISENLRQSYSRYKFDKKINERDVKVLQNCDFVVKKSKDVHVGDVLLVNNKESVPADMLLLATEGYESEIFLDLTAVVGRKDLVKKVPVKDTQQFSINDGIEIANLIKHIENIRVSQPDSSFTSFSGKIKMKGNPGVTKLTIENLVKMNTVVLGCEKIIGIAVYTGMETKTWLNSKTQKLIRITKFQKFVNQIMMVNCFLLFFFTILSFGLSYTKTVPGIIDTWDVTFVNNLILFNNFIPVSLYLALRISKFCQTFLINFTNTGIRIENPRVLETLGKVEYILAAKTGILTNENLKVKTCIIKNQAYIEKYEIFIDRDSSDKEAEDHLMGNVEDFDRSFESYPRLFENLSQEISAEQIEQEEWYFLLCISICNHFFEDQASKSTSAEERVLIAKAEELGFSLFYRSKTAAKIKFNETEHSYDILGANGLFSEQGYTKIVIKERGSENALMLIKGQTEHILNLFEDDFEQALAEQCLNSKYLINLRKIICGYKILTKEEVNAFIFDYNHSKLSPINIEGKTGNVFENFEKGLMYLGVIGIENPITKNTKECIESLTQAGIKTWIVTGQSEENTLIAGSNLGLFTQNSKIVKISNYLSDVECLQELSQALNKEVYHDGNADMDKEYHNQFSGPIDQIKNELNGDSQFLESEMNKSPELFKETKRTSKRTSKTDKVFKGRRKGSKRRSINKIFWSHSSLSIEKIDIQKRIAPDSVDFVMSVNSKILEYVLASSAHRRKFVSLLFAAKCVVFYSMSPDQKISLVRLLKHNFAFRPCTLTIGGENTDIGMLDAADIGVSVGSLKDPQGYNSDIRISEFGHLSKLILQHGHYSYIGLSKIFILTIYKQMLVQTIFLLYQIQTDFSGAWLIHYDLIVIYELFTSLVPIVLVGIFSKDVSNLVDLENSSVYTLGFFNNYLSSGKILLMYTTGLFHGCIIYLTTIYGVGNIINSNGFTEDLETKGIIGFILINLALLQNILGKNARFDYLNLSILIFEVSSLLMIILLTVNGHLTNYTISSSILESQSTAWVIIFILPLFFFDCCFFVFYMMVSFSMIKFKNRLEQFQTNFESVYKDTVEWNTKELFGELELKKWNLRFLPDFREVEYQNLLAREYKMQYKFVLTLMVIIVWIAFILSKTNAIPSGFISQGSNFIIVILLTLALLITFYKNLKWDYFNIVFFIGVMIVISIQISSPIKYATYVLPCAVIFFSIFINYRFWISFIQVIIIFIISVIGTFIENSHQGTSFMCFVSFHIIIFMLGISSYCIVIAYVLDINKRKVYVESQKIKIEEKKMKNILSYLFPQFVRKRVKDGDRYIVEDKGTVSVIFCDMCYFDDIVQMYTPQELTSFLNDVFGKLDKLCEIVGVTKIETVGKTYLACAGLKDSEIRMDPALVAVPHARRAIEMGLAVIREVEKIITKDGSPLMFKIGINSGQVTAGVVGHHKPQFSLFGDTINTASRMSSTLTEPNAIQISMSTYDLLGNRSGLIFSERNPEVKGKGTMKTQIVDVPKHEPSGAPERNSNTISMRGSIVLEPSGKHTSTDKLSIIAIPTSHNNIENSNDAESLKNQNQKIIKESGFHNIWRFCKKNTSNDLEFKKNFLQVHFLIPKIGIIIAIIGNVLLIILEIIGNSLQDYANISALFLAVFLFEEVILILLFTRLAKDYEKTLYGWALNMIFFIEFPIFFISSFFIELYIPLIYTFFAFRFLQMNYCSVLLFGNRLYFNILAIILWILTMFMNNPSGLICSVSIIFIILIMITIYLQEQKSFIKNILRKNASKEIEQTEELLAHMMPPQVLKNLQEENLITDRLMNVTLMYADIVGFTAWSSTKTPKEVVGMLSGLFTRFDNLCIEHDVYKVHTIGDCYVIMGYKTNQKRKPAKEAVNVVNFAKSLIEVIEETNQQNHCELNMRVGIHTGEVIGGITGTNIVRYDIYGSDVLIANKMESNGEPGKIAVSESTKLMLKEYKPHKYKFTQTKEINIPVLEKTIKLYILTDLSEVLK